MSDEYQLRRDIDELFNLASENKSKVDSLTVDAVNLLHRLGLDQESSGKFNYAVIKKVIGDVTYEEFWILSNAYYDYEKELFVKIDANHTSFGIEIQANGTYHGEAELGYSDNTGINLWRNPKKADVASSFPNWATDSTYDFHPFMDDTSYIGLGVKATGEWKEYGVMAGWNNMLMLDSYGGMTVGGAGFEVDGNGIYPFTRLTSSRYTDSNDDVWCLLGLLDNAYHPTKWGWECDSNSTYSWFVGLKSPEQSDLVKDNKNTSFVVMYNDSPAQQDPNTHVLDVSKWHTVFESKITDASDNTGAWSDLTLTGNFYNFDNANKVKYRRVNKTVQITGLAVLNAYPSALEELTIGTLPSDCRPHRDITCLCELENDEKLWTCTIKSNGDLTFNRLRDGTGFVGGTAFSDVLAVNMTYLV